MEVLRMSHRVASLESLLCSLLATLSLLLVLMLLAGGLAITGPAILTFSIWISILAPMAVGIFLVARARRSVAGAGAVVAALAVWIAYFWRSNPGPFLWPMVLIASIALIVQGTRQDVQTPHAWLFLLPRFV